MRTYFVYSQGKKFALLINRRQLRWYGTLKNDDVDEKVKPLNTDKKHFGTILLNLSLGKCEIQGMYTVVEDFLHSNGHSNGCLQSENDQKCRFILTYKNDTL